MFKSMKASPWAAISILNLVIVAGLGVLMRLKILYELPWIDQRFTLHAHSHFAFSGWITQTLMLCIALVILGKKFSAALPVRYNYLLTFNLFCSYGMLISFLQQGYAPASIAFSTLTILISIIFYIFCKKDVSVSSQKSVWWSYIHAAMLFNMLSALGTFSLAYTMATQPQHTELRLASVYFYLHFQYNGWFFLSCMGLFHYWLSVNVIHIHASKVVSKVFIICCVPTYLLSINWMQLTDYIHTFNIVTAFIQFGIWSVFTLCVWRKRNDICAKLPLTSRLLFVLVLIAATIKFGLQTASAFPVIATWAFGLRPVVIAYLHLVLLGMISLFLIGWLYCQNALVLTGSKRSGLSAFVGGVVLNEVFLMIQGVSSMSGIYVVYIPELLAAAGLMMFMGLFFLFCSVHCNTGIRKNK